MIGNTFFAVYKDKIIMLKKPELPKSDIYRAIIGIHRELIDSYHFSLLFDLMPCGQGCDFNSS